MSIEVQNLTKIYGVQRALDDISFSSAKGEVTGFLGPNGAGKSTTMKIATGFVRPSSGTITLEGVDVVKEPLKVKRMTGYLPEHNPLYLDMYVKEYLRFVGAAYKLKKVKHKVEEMITLVGLEREQRKKIGTLSKGYRQRVGLAQALIHDPEVLILDEPTGGLDPNQLVEIRKLIKQASENKTVIFSTHVMQEVEVLCNHIVIINKGKIVANDKVENLKTVQSGKLSYKVEFEEEIDIRLFKDFETEYREDGTYMIAAETRDLRKQIMKIVGDRELPLVNISKEEQSLERVFQELTKGT
ncbi:MAG: gliding motility-associated ABC transporter ATP-binding subunit GldA [Ekhidna sp.]|nr:gliding motility-associated ABC transporter ATP-binding subunit GldA [Ekhidna sp.]MBC6426677.1 gliding motility-associated ABC transporter ATP-binding subunit GldA [Ekhidna sp.]